MEEVDTITVAVSGIDINKVEPLDSRRLVTFINHYLATTVSFLNHFATQCESKLDRMQQQLHRVECRLKLLECKLASIPGIPSTPTVESAAAAERSASSACSNSSQGAPVPGTSCSNSSTSATKSKSIPNHITATSASKSDLESSSNTKSNNLEKQTNRDDNDDDQHDGKTAGTMTSAPSTSNKEDPKYAKYFKMVTVGVPIPAVKQKMMQDGVDPSALDN